MVRGNRDRVASDLLRQLALGLSSYRLFPGDVEQAAFVAAVERIRDAAEIALAANAIHYDLRAAVFHGPDGEPLADETLERLSRAAYERGVEHVHLRAVPTVEELAALFEVLTMDEQHVRAAPSGVDGLARARGVTAIALGGIEPEAGDAGDPVLDQLSAAQLDLWSQVLDPVQFVRQILEETDDLSATARADKVYRRLKEIESALPTSFTVRGDFLEGVESLVDALPLDLRREFAALAMARASSDGMAERFLNHLTDAELAQLIELVSAAGADPFDLARRLQQVVGRQTSFVDLVEGMFGRQLPTTTELSEQTRPTVAALAGQDESLVKPTVIDLMSREILHDARVDAAEIRLTFPATPSEQREVALTAFRDYLRIDEDGPMVDGAINGWRAALRDALAGRQGDVVRELVEAVSDGANVPGRRAKLIAATRIVLDAELIAEMAQWAREDGDVDSVRDVLAGFDEAAVEALLDALAAEEDRGRRAVMLGMISELGLGYADIIADRLDDDRWYVVRNTVTILGRVGGAGVLSALVRAANHRDPSVRREVVRSLVSAAGSDAIPYLARLGEDADREVSRAAMGALGAMSSAAAADALAGLARQDLGVDERRRALSLLSTSTAPNAVGLLDQLAQRRSRPRLPWTLRRYARKSARRVRGSS